MKFTYTLFAFIAIFNLNLSAQNGGDLAKKIADLTTAIEASPDDVDLLLSRGDTYMLNQEAEKAIADYKKIVTLYNGNPLNKKPETVATAYYKLSSYHLSVKKDGTSALAYITEGLKLKPKEKAYLLQEARTLASMPEKKDEAIAKFDNLVAAYPTDEQILVEYGSFIKKWDAAKAALLFEKVLRVNVLNVQALNELGDLFSNLAKQITDKDKASACRNKAIGYFKHLYNLQPTNTSVKNKLIELYNLQGRTAEANELQN